MHIRNLVILTIAVCGLFACGSVRRLGSLQPGLSTETDATKLAGRKPGYVWNNADGTRTLEYSNQPLDGSTSYMVTVDTAGKVLGVRPINVDPATTALSVGMGRDEVRRLLGSPRTIATYMSGEEIWDWNTATGSPGYLVRFNAHFRDGKLVRTSTRTLDLNDCSIVSPC